ncbi:RNA-guided endonuclease TnpB family protein [Sporolactobacillus sp. THM19-2]|uniref:RNA-guided endonuclease TnpB family protein n=1 Tax=Sporolactobacillus sp. THM19-2 TaxID=2511171 RepID=UPI00102115FB|nr:RNA-guided endonuclease TnpB family protein [Sporolactobacillus sp. THM19-2]RYL94548.1 transposase [Sporolactobacillus sp. THM19-2]
MQSKKKKTKSKKTVTKNVFLYGHPTKVKQDLLQTTQKAYVHQINHFINVLMADLPKYLLILLINDKKNAKIGQLEKEHRTSLGSAYGQNAVRHAITELHNHLIRQKNKLYGWMQSHEPDLLPYACFISLLHASVLDEDELTILKTLIQREQGKGKPDAEKLAAYTDFFNELSTVTSEQRAENRAIVHALYLERLENTRLPFVKKAPLQLDARLATLEEAKNIRSSYVLSVKLTGSKHRVLFPVNTSRNGRRRLAQYKTGGMTVSWEQGKIRVGVPIKKNITKQKWTEKVGADAGINDLFHSSIGHAYGSFSGRVKQFEELLETRTGHRSSLRNVMKRYQKELKKTDDLWQQSFLRTKIAHIAKTLNGRKSLQKVQRRYRHQRDLAMHEAVNQLFEEVRQDHLVLVLEDLELTNFDRGKKANKRNSSWIRGQLFQKITERLNWYGMPYVTVDPAYTSQMCHACGHLDKTSRSGKSFVCTVCGHSDDADHNAALNIKDRADDAEIKEIAEKYPYNTKKRHQAIKEHIEERYRSQHPQVAPAV